MSELESGNESDVSSESSVSSETASSVQSQETAPEQEVQAAPQKEAPFNEHPRFKELIAERNAEREAAMKYAQEAASFKAQLEQYNKQTQSQNQPKKPDFNSTLERLKGIDPEFAEFQKTLYEQVQAAQAAQQELEELKQWRNDAQAQQNSQAALTQFDKLCGDNKISEADKELYRQAVTNMAYARNSSAKDLPALFTEAHQNLSKYFEARDRSVTESYVTKKKSDSVPATQTGGVPSSSKPSSSANVSKDDVKSAFAQALKNGMRI